ncbi:MAG: lantibiotic dehydratase, partial [bacterium]
VLESGHDLYSKSGEVLFPYFVCRVAGISAQHMEQLRASESAQLFEALNELEKELHLYKEKISGLIYHAVGATKDNEQRNALLKFKRDIYNLRPFPQQQLAKLLVGLPDTAANEISALGKTLEEHKSILSELERVYSAEECLVRRKFQSFVTDTDFKKGLLLSSQSLFASLERYTACDNAELKAKDEQIERGLLRYFSRMAMKTSPFATFCVLIPGEFRAGDTLENFQQAVFGFLGHPQAKRSFVRLNKSLYGILLEHLKTHSAVRNVLDVELNPTIWEEENRFVFLSLVNGREVFQRLQKNAALDLIMRAFAQQPHLPLRQLIDALCANPKVDASREEAENYLDKLLEIGFLRFRMGIHEQEVDWDKPFGTILDSMDDDHA